MISLPAHRRWDSKAMLLAHLEACDVRTLVVGLDAEAPRTYYSFSVASSHGKGEIGVISSGFGVDAAAVLMNDGRRLLLGHDTWVTWVDVKALAVVTSRRLDGVFYDFLPVDNDEETVVLHELGALRVDANGAVKWSVDTDIVEASSIDANGNLIVSVMDGPKLVVSLATGTVSRSAQA
jgi:hypothetical protein